MTPPLMPQIQKAGAVVPPPQLEAAVFEHEALIPLQLIRQHTKTDDVPHVTDELLALYRKSALYSAEQYTGLLLREQKVITQQVDAPSSAFAFGRIRRDYYTVTLKYPSADGLIYLYGGKQVMTVVTLRVQQGETKVRVPFNHLAIDMMQCCGPPCGSGPVNSGMSIMYKAGLARCEDLPPPIVMGALKYIAWMISNPGDEALASVNMNNVNPQAGRNNASYQSGAIEEWRLCLPDAV